MTLLNKAHSIRSADAVKAWLVTCARNLAFDYGRKKKPLPMQMEHLEIAVDRERDEKKWNQQRLLQINEISQLVEEICQKEQDDTLKLFYCDGKSAKEIASLKKVAISTITNRISRQRKKFKSHLQERISKLWDDI